MNVERNAQGRSVIFQVIFHMGPSAIRRRWQALFPPLADADQKRATPLPSSPISKGLLARHLHIDILMRVHALNNFERTSAERRQIRTVRAMTTGYLCDASHGHDTAGHP